MLLSLTQLFLSLALLLLSGSSRTAAADESYKDIANEFLDKLKTDSQDAFNKAGDWFKTQYKNFESLYATSKEDLQKKAESMEGFLQSVKEKKDSWVQATKGETNKALQNVDKWYQEVKDFNQQVKTNATAKADDLTQQWKTKLDNMKNEGLDKVIDAAESARSSATRSYLSCSSVALAILACLTLIG